jgi:hypothetical protein
VVGVGAWSAARAWSPAGRRRGKRVVDCRRMQRVNEHSTISVKKVMRFSAERASISNESIATYPPVSLVQHPFGSIRPSSPCLM